MSAGIYLHIPFCRSRCSYCDFATDVWRSDASVERYVSALCRELSSASPALPDVGVPAADTIYFGGGTPSLLNAEQVRRMLNSAKERFTVADDAEITMEMNPATVTAETLLEYRRLGINRTSFGVQTFNDRDLKLLARGHNSADARSTFELLRSAGFANISFDLIAGLPGQTLADWSSNLDKAVAMRPEHISLYLLEIHSGTPLAEQLDSGRRPMPDDALAAEMYEMMIERLSAAGYAQYEISNFSLPGFESRHNKKYWRLEPVYGFGVSAHSFDGVHQRYANERDTAKYVEMIETDGGAVVEKNVLTAKQLSAEFAFLNLRLTQGLDLDEFRTRFGYDIGETFAADLAFVREAGLIEGSEKNIRLTRKGMLYSNDVFTIFV